MDCYNINSCFKYCDKNNEMQHLEKKKKKKKKSGKKQACGRKEVKLSTDPQSVQAARERRHRISERFKILQSLVPGGSKLDTVSMLDEAIVYVKFLKNQLWWLIQYHTHQHQNINFNYNNNNNYHVVLDEQPSTSVNDLVPYDDRDPRSISTRDDSGLYLQNASSYDQEILAQILEFQDSWLAETSV